MNRILVLGGDGFVGRSFVSLQTRFSRLRIISRCPTFPGINEIVVDDLRRIDEVSFHDIDVVFNCLGIAHRKDSSNKNLFYLVNRDLALSLAGKAKAAGVRKFVQMSSISVYGDQASIDVSSIVTPNTHYGRSKAEADAGLLSLKSADFDVLLLRPPMIYGEGAPGNMAKLIRFVDRFPIVPFFNATEQREFLCIGNFVKQLEYCIEKDLSGVALMKDTRQFSTKELATIIIEELGSNKRLIKFPFKKLMQKFFPSYHRKLFGGLFIESNILFPSSESSSFFDPEKSFREMVRKFNQA